MGAPSQTLGINSGENGKGTIVLQGKGGEFVRQNYQITQANKVQI
jgi:hypothetical protein